MLVQMLRSLCNSYAFVYCFSHERYVLHDLLVACFRVKLAELQYKEDGDKEVVRTVVGEERYYILSPNVKRDDFTVSLKTDWAFGKF